MKLLKKIEIYKMTIILAALILVSIWPAKNGEDIVAARDNFHNLNPTDFWGGVCTLIYGNIPAFIFDWQTNLVIMQISISTVGLILFTKYCVDIKKQKKLFFLLILYYIALCLASQTTRDGLQLSIFLLSSGIIVSLKKERTNAIKNFYFLIGVIGFIVGAAIRPWLSISVAFLVIALLLFSINFGNFKKRSSFLLAVFILVSTLPICLEISSLSLMKLERSYPEQQVIVMDFAAGYCWGIDKSAGLTASSGLSLFLNEKKAELKSICQYFKSNTWVSLNQPLSPSSVGLSSSFNLNNGKDHHIAQKVRKLWFGYIFNDPITYLQNKIIFATQVLTSGDSRNIRLSNVEFKKLKSIAEMQKLFEGIIFLIYDLIISLHLISPIVTIMLWVLIYFFKNRNQKIKSTLNLNFHNIILISSLTWFALTTFAYIGDNGRYTYTISIILLISTFIKKNEIYKI